MCLNKALQTLSQIVCQNKAIPTVIIKSCPNKVTTQLIVSAASSKAWTFRNLTILVSRSSACLPTYQKDKTLSAKSQSRYILSFVEINVGFLTVLPATYFLFLTSLRLLVWKYKYLISWLFKYMCLNFS